MDVKGNVIEELNLQQKYLRSDNVGKTRYLCVVPDAWVQHIINGKYVPIPKKIFNDLAQWDEEQLLASSNEKLPKGWQRVSIQVLLKSDELLESLIEEPLCGEKEPLTCELAAALSRQYEANLWYSARHEYPTAVWDTDTEPKTPIRRSCTDLTRECLRRAFRSPRFISLKTGQSLTVAAAPAPYPAPPQDPNPHPNIANPFGVLESSRAFFVVCPYAQHSLWDAVVFSPAKFQDSYAVLLFIVYQTLHAFRHFHSQGLSMGELTLRQISIDDCCWATAQYPPPLTPNLAREFPADGATAAPPDADCGTGEGSAPLPSEPGAVGESSPMLGSTVRPHKPVLQSNGESFTHSAHGRYIWDLTTLGDLPSIVQQWARGEISNFDYLMVLNQLSGRKMLDPNHHPIMPWVMDFSQADGGYRDLTQSKYRLTKGDSQLDLTYEMQGGLKDPFQVPHHIAEVLSDITYYVYKARRTQKSVLCTHVRSRWVPHEYPASMERLQEWTPDECIPEFFTDAELLHSIHNDLPDLEVPAWAASPEDFIRRHREVLEGPHVSANLHHWIDVTFGYKLSGSASVQAKNVCLQLVNQHTELLNYGVVQLFHHPHPPKMASAVGREATGSRGRSKTLVPCEDLPIGSNFDEPMTSPALKQHLNPILPLEQLEALYEFSIKTSGVLPKPTESTSLPELPAAQCLIARDMQTMGCLLVELFLSSRSRSLMLAASLKQRYPMACHISAMYRQDIPRPVREAIDLLLRSHRKWDPAERDQYGAPFHYDPVSPDGLPLPTVDSLLHPAFSPIRFPPYFRGLYMVLSKIKVLQRQESVVEASNINILDKIRQLKKLANQKVTLMTHYLQRRARILRTDGLALLLPYATELLSNPVTAVQATWGLFNPIAEVLGPRQSAQFFLALLLKLFDSEHTTPKYIKIYHRSFIIQLIIRLGLSNFLHAFVPPLIEAIAGYKNFVEEDYINRQISKEAEAQANRSVGNDSFDLGKSVSDQDAVARQSPKASESDAKDPRSAKNEVSLDSVEDALLYQFDDSDVNETEENALLDEVFDCDMFEDGNEAPGRRFMRGGDGGYRQGGEDAISTDSSDTQRDTSSGEGRHARCDDDEGGGDGDGDEDEDGPGQDLLGRSLGRVSVHSVSRFLSPGANGDPERDPDTSSVTDEEDQLEHSKTSSTSGGGGAMVKDSRDVSDSASARTASSNTETLETGPYKAKSAAGRAKKLVPSLVRSETEDFSTSVSSVTDYNICHVAAESVKWLAHRLGPVLTAKHLSGNLLRMLMLCYVGEEQLEVIEREGDYLSAADRFVVGDLHAAQVLECLACITILYGENVILLQYFQHVKELIQSAVRKLNSRTEAGLVSCAALLVHMIPYLSDTTLLDILKDTLLADVVLQILKIVSSTYSSFPSGSRARQAICFKLVDILYIVSMRIGFDMTREHMTYTLQKFFAAFSRVHEGDSKGPPGGDPSEGPGGEPATQTAAQKKLPGENAGDTVMYELKVDNYSKELKVVTPVNCQPSPPQPQHRRQSSLGSLKYSLSPLHEEQDEGQFLEKPKDVILKELRETFTPELAHAAYIPFCQLAGGIHMEQNLINDDLIRQLCALHDQTLSQQQRSQLLCTPGVGVQDAGQLPPTPTEERDVVSGSFGRNVSLSGNRISFHGGADPATSGRESAPAPVPGPGPTPNPTGPGHSRSPRLSGDTDINDKLRSPDMKNNPQRHLKGDWLAYWEHEVGMREKDNAFSLKQIKLQTYSGHTSSVRCIYVLDNENSFISASKDKTVRLWSLRSFGDGSSRDSCKWSYSGHRKSVFSVGFLESTRHVVSCDGNIHIWDPFMEKVVAIVDSPKNAPVSAIATLTAPSTCLVTATVDPVVRFLDARVGCYTHQFKCTTTPAGSVRCLAANDTWLAVGYSSGVISTLDVRTGGLMASWKGHEAEILQMKVNSSGTLVTSCFDQSMAAWNAKEGLRQLSLKGCSEPSHCLSLYQDLVISGTTVNKIGVHSLEKKGDYTTSKLRPDVFRGVLTTLSLLPLNRLLLLGADNGEIRLVA